MATMDIFNADAFSAVELTAAIEKVPHRPQLLGSLELFAPRPVRTETVAVEERSGTLALIQTSQRGAPLDERATEKRNIRDFRTLRIAKGDTVTASEIQNIRSFGTESELMQVMDEVMRRLAGPTGLMSEVELTHENMRLGAVQGIVTDADGSTIIDWYSAFGVTQPSEIDFDLDNATPASGAVRKSATRSSVRCRSPPPAPGCRARPASLRCAATISGTTSPPIPRCARPTSTPSSARPADSHIWWKTSSPTHASNAAAHAARSRTPLPRESWSASATDSGNVQARQVWSLS